MYLLENQMFVEAPRTSAPLVLEIYPFFPGTRMPKSLPQHGQVIFLGAKANNVSDAYSLRISAFGTVSDVERVVLALTPTA